MADATNDVPRWRTWWFASSLYDALIKGRPARFERKLGDIWDGDPEIANSMFQGRYTAAGFEAVAPNQAPWTVATENRRWFAHFHSFGWLRDFRAEGSATGRQRAQDLTLAWLRTYPKWSPLVWRPDILAQRLAAWALHADFIAVGGRAEFAPAFHASFAKQLRHLSRGAQDARPGTARLATATGWAIASLAVARGGKNLRLALRLLEEELTQQVLADGGHIERNPERLHAVLRDCLTLRAALREARHGLPPALVEAIERLAPMLRFFRHGDGTLALFNGGHEDVRERIDATLAVSESKARPPQSAPLSGFERLAAQRTLLLLDCGEPPPEGLDRDAHAGSLSFELSMGSERMVVNCGAPVDDDPGWRKALRSTAAHSTLTIADTNSVELSEQGVVRPSRTHTVRRLDDAERIGAEATHDGYAANFGFVHHRRLALEAGGNRIVGEDWLSATDTQRARNVRTATLRFHLHPDVSASLRQDQRAVILRLPKGSGWVFGAPTGVLALEDSIYFGGDRPRRSQQILLQAPARDGLSLAWAIERVGE